MTLSRKQLEEMADRIGRLAALATGAELGMAAQLLEKAHETIKQELGLASPISVAEPEIVRSDVANETIVPFRAKLSG